jgi:hypothetical protein
MGKHDLQFEEFASDVLRGDDSDYVEMPISTRTFALVGLLAVLIMAAMLARVVALNIVQGGF